MGSRIYLHLIRALRTPRTMPVRFLIVGSQSAKVVEAGGLEPPIPRLRVECFIRFSYASKDVLAGKMHPTRRCHYVICMPTVR